MIKTEFLNFDFPPEVTWIFFSSPRAVEATMRLHDLSSVKIGVMGKGTANALPDHLAPDFTGEGTSSEIALAFLMEVKNERVFFPMSDRSLRTVQAAFPEQQVCEALAYRTTPKSVKIPQAEVYFFTSPSNVEAFFSVNKMAPNAIGIAKGEASLQALQRFHKNSIMAPNYSVLGSWQAIFSALHS